MVQRQWLPELMRRRPRRRLVCTYRTFSARSLPFPAEAMEQALRASRVGSWRRLTDSRWQSALQWRTLVYGLIRRDVDEDVAIEVTRLLDGWQLEVSCTPVETHAAHASGAAGVLVLSALVWLTGGWLTGGAAGMTTVLAGLLWTDATRTVALQAPERRLRVLAEDVGWALWPEVPAQVSRPLQSRP